MKIMIIDPWGVKTLSPYSNGFFYGMSKCSNLVVEANYYFENNTSATYQIDRLFFKKSERMKNGVIRKIVRGFEYVNAYNKILRIVKKERFDFIEIEWLLMYRIDFFYIKKLKKYCKVLYKAHNVIPHEHGDKKINILKKIYSIVDLIILHGNSIKNEFELLFPTIDVDKIIIQPFGMFNMNTSYDISSVPNLIIEKLNHFDRKYLFFGGLFYNKGVDRLIDIWSKKVDRDSILIIAGKSSPDYYELIEQSETIKSLSNLVLLDEFICENTLNYLISICDSVIIPYRHASMSGVLFTAATFSKPVLCTNVGSLCEYFIDHLHGYLVPNDYDGIEDGLRLLDETSKTKLKEMGISFNSYVVQNYSWNKICESLVEEIYSKLFKEE